jgi:autotransporter-associated beta strand protein
MVWALLMAAGAGVAPAEDFNWGPTFNISSLGYTLVGLNFTTPAKDQGYAGVCWDFAATGTLEARYMLTRNDTSYKVNLSEQQVPMAIDNYGGGNAFNALDYQVASGLVLESELPYHGGTFPSPASEWPLQTGWQSRAVKATTRVRASSNTDAIKAALKSNGPMTVGVSASDNFYWPGGGVPGNTGNTDHEILLVGYHDATTADASGIRTLGGYWIIKNSWGTGWGSYGGYGFVPYTYIEGRNDIYGLTGPAYATGAFVTATWNGGSGTWAAGTQSWSTTSGTTPAAYAWKNEETQAVFNAGGTGTAVSISGTAIAHGLTINPGAVGYTFSGGALTVTGGGIVANESLVINCPVSIGAPQTWTTATGKTLTINNDVHTLISTLTVDGAGNTHIGGAIDGGGTLNSLGAAAGDLVKNGTGTLTLAGSSSYASTISLNAGSLVLSPAAGLTATYSGLVSGAGNLTMSGSGTVVLSATNTYSGITTLKSGVLSVGRASGIGSAASSAGNLVFDGGVLRYTGAAAIINRLFTLNAGGGSIDASGTGAILWNNTGTLLGAGGILTLTGTNTGANTLSARLTGASSVVKSGAGTWILAATNSYTGGTTVTDGMLQLGAANALPAATTVSLSNSATAVLNLNGNSQSITALSGGGSVMLGSGTLSIGNACQASYSGAISGTGGLTKLTAGYQLLSGSNLYGGATLVSGGVLALAGGSALPATTALTVNGSGSLNLADGTARATAVAGLTLAGTATLTLDWNGGSVDQLTTAAAATASGKIGIALNPSNSPTGSNLSLVHAASGLGGVTCYLANNTDYTAALTLSGTDILVGAYASRPGLTNAYWVGGQVPGALNAMALSKPDGTISNWSTTADSYTATALIPGPATNVVITGTPLQNSLAAGASMSVNSLTFNGTTPVTVASDGYEITLGSTAGGTASALNIYQNTTLNTRINLGAANVFTVANGLTLKLGGSLGGAGSLTLAGAGTTTPSDTNSYTGSTTLSGGVLSVNYLTLGGKASSIGQSGSDAGNLIFNGGGLRYNGSTGITNRLFTLNAGGGTLDASGAGSINWNNTGTLAGPGGVLTLTGSNQSNNTLAAAISGGSSVIKTGVGTWVLTGGNTYSGSTSINNGKLYINGTITGALISVAAGATLGGTGSASPAVATLDSGGIIEPGYGGAGSLGLGGLSFAGNAVINVNAITNYGSTPALNLTNSGGLNVGGTTGAITIMLAGNAPTAVGTAHLIKYSGALQGSAGIAAFTINSSNVATAARLPMFTLSNATAGYVDVNYILDYPVWSGAADGKWITSPTVTAVTTTNWNLMTQPLTNTNFIVGDSPVFDDTASGTTTVTIDAATVSPSAVTFNNSSKSYTLAGSKGITGSASLTKNGSGLLTLTNSNSYTGGTNLNGGILQANSLAALSGSGSLIFGGGTLRFGTAFDLTNRTGAIASGVQAIFDTNNLAVTLSGSLRGAGGLTKQGAGSLTLSAAQGYGGPTTVSAGTLKPMNPLPAATALTIVAGATLDLAGCSQQVASLSGAGALTNSSLTSPVTFTLGDAGSSAFSGSIADAGSAGSISVAKVGTGTATLGGSNTYRGTTTVNAGTLQFATRAALYNGVTSNWTTTNLVVASTATAAFNVGGNGEFTVADINHILTNTLFATNSMLGIDTARAVGGTVSFSTNITGGFGLRKLGTGTLVLSGTSNSYSGPTTVSGGTLQVNGALSGGGLVSVPSGGTLGLAAAASIARDVTLSGGTLNLTGNLAATTTLTLYDGTVNTIGNSAGAASVAMPLPAAGATPVLYAPAGQELSITNKIIQYQDNATVTVTAGAMPFKVGGGNIVSHIDQLILQGGTTKVERSSMTYAAGLQQGFLQGDTGAGVDFITPNPKNEAPQLSILAARANNNGLLFMNNVSGGTTTHATQVYTGQIFVGPSGTLNFGKGWDDSAMIKVDGTTVLQSDNNHRAGNCWQDQVTSGTLSYTPNTWHDFEARVANNSGGWGCTGETGWSAGGFGIGYSATFTGPAGYNIPAAQQTNYVEIVDDGHMNLLRFSTMTTLAVSMPTTDVTVTSDSTLNLNHASLATLGNLSIAAATLSLATATGVSFDNIVATDTAAIAAGVPLALRTGNVTVADGKTLTLNPVIADGTTPTALHKLGTGTLVLGQANTYTGATTVSNGTLLVNTPSGSGVGTGEIHVAAGATLGGCGIIGASSTIDGIHAPGDGGLAGIQTFSNGLAYTASSRLQWQLNANTDASSARGPIYDGINITDGTFSINSGATLDLSFGGTLNFRDSFWSAAHTWTLADLGLGVSGDGGDGVFTVAAIPNGNNNYSASRGTFSVTRAADADSKLDVMLNWSFTATTYDSWATSKGLSGASASDDPDQDGLCNGLEFVLGGEHNPATAGCNSLDKLPRASHSADNLVFTFQRAAVSLGSATLCFQWATDPAFSDAVTVPIEADSSPVVPGEVIVIITNNGADSDTIVITVPAAKANGSGKLFGRLGVAVP